MPSDVYFRDYTPAGASAQNWGKSSWESFTSAKGQFDCFLAVYLADAEKARKYLGEEHINNASRRCLDWLPLNRLDIQLFDDFAKYLATDARKRQGPPDPLAEQAADRYLSSIKTGITTAYDALVPNAAITGFSSDARWTRIRSGMGKMFSVRALREGRSLKGTEKKECTKRDLITMVIVAVWSSDPKLLGFAALLVAMYHLAGRVMETSSLTLKNLSLVEPSEFGGNDSILQVGVFRSKTNTFQNCQVMNHRDHFFLDLPFMLAMTMATSNQPPSERNVIFPDFYQNVVEDMSDEALLSALYDDNDDEDADAETNTGTVSPRRRQQRQNRREKASKAASKVFTDAIKSLFSFSEKLSSNSDDGDDAEEEEDASTRVERACRSLQSRYIPKNLRVNVATRAHQLKKLAVNTMHSVFTLPVTMLVYRAGWIVKALHTIFDYLQNSEANDRQSARALSGWDLQAVDSVGHGGKPPRLESLQGISQDADGEETALDNYDHYSMACELSRWLFQSYTEVEGGSAELFEFLTASLLLRLRQFLFLLQSHPQSPHRTTTEKVDKEYAKKHRLLFALHNAMYDVNEQMGTAMNFDTLLFWADAIEKDFVQRNAPYVPFDVLQAVSPGPFVMDTRTISSQLNALHAQQQALSNQFLDHSRYLRTISMTLGQVSQAMTEITTANRQLTQENQRLHEMVAYYQARETDHPRLALAPTNAAAALPQVRQVSPTAATARRQDDAQLARRQEEPALNRITQVPTSTAGLTAVDCFYNWFCEGWYKERPTDMKSQSVRKTYEIIRTSVSYLLLYTPHHVPLRPSGGVEDVSAWKKEVYTMAEAAFSQAFKLANEWSIKTGKRKKSLDRNAVTAKPFCEAMKDVPRYLLPEGPPLKELPMKSTNENWQLKPRSVLGSSQPAAPRAPPPANVEQPAPSTGASTAAAQGGVVQQIFAFFSPQRQVAQQQQQPAENWGIDNWQDGNFVGANGEILESSEDEQELDTVEGFDNVFDD